MKGLCKTPRPTRYLYHVAGFTMYRVWRLEVCTGNGFRLSPGLYRGLLQKPSCPVGASLPLRPAASPLLALAPSVAEESVGKQRGAAFLWADVGASQNPNSVAKWCSQVHRFIMIHNDSYMFISVADGWCRQVKETWQKMKWLGWSLKF